MGGLQVSRMVAAGGLVTATTAFRVGVGWLELYATRTVPLARLALRASIGGADAERAEAAFRDRYLALSRDMAEVSWREQRRGVEDLDTLTRPGGLPDARPRRPHRVKP